MELRQLRYFIAVAESHHIGRAAERLNLSQPPLSRQIQQLEEELAVKLFRRTPRGMELTQAGKELLRDAQNIRNLVSQASQRAQRAGQGQVGRLDIGINGSAIFGLVSQVLAAFHAKYPEIEVVLHHTQTSAQLPALRHRQVHIVFERMLPEETDIQVELVAREPLVLALPKNHRLAAKEGIDVGDLRDETLFIGSSPTIAAMALNLCRAHGFEPRIAPPLSDDVTATLMAVAGMGVTVVPSSTTSVQFPGVTYRPLLTHVKASMELHCFYLRSEASSPQLVAMLETVRSFQGREKS